MIVNNENRLVELIRDYDRLYIYGAGHNGNLVKNRLLSKGIKLSGFCVTHKKDNFKEDVFQIDEIAEDMSACYIIATSSSYRSEIENELADRGIKNFITLSDKILVTMDRLQNLKLRFQTHLVEHCNLNCRGCYHFSPLAKEEYLSLQEYERDIQQLSILFDGKMEEILLLGGEPLLHPEVDSFIDISRKYFTVGNIKILTNGLLLNTISDSFYESLKNNDAQLWVTKYNVPFDYDYAERRAADHGLEIRYFNTEPVRIMGHQPLDLTGGQNAKANFYKCYRANECVDLKHGRMYPCILPAEINPFNEYFGMHINSCKDDSVDIYSVESGEELLEAMENPIPFCRYCDRSDVAISGRIPWSQSKYCIDEWTK